MPGEERDRVLIIFVWAPDFLALCSSFTHACPVTRFLSTWHLGVAHVNRFYETTELRACRVNKEVLYGVCGHSPPWNYSIILTNANFSVGTERLALNVLPMEERKVCSSPHCVMHLHKRWAPFMVCITGTLTSRGPPQCLCALAEPSASPCCYDCFWSSRSELVLMGLQCYTLY